MTSLTLDPALPLKQPLSLPSVMEAAILNMDKLLIGEGHYREIRHCLYSDVSLLTPNDGSPAQTLSAMLLHV